MNVGVFSWATYSLYNRPDLRTNPRLLTIGASASAALIAAEGSYASYVAKTPEGQREIERARREGSAVYYHVRKAMFRPGVPASLGAALGLINLAVVGGAGWLAYCYWDLPRWDKKAVSAITIGLVALWGGEGWVSLVSLVFNNWWYWLLGYSQRNIERREESTAASKTR